MKKIIARIIPLLLCLSLCSCDPFGLFGSDEVEDDEDESLTYSEGLEFTSNGDGTCSLSGMGTCSDSEIVIPRVSPDGDKVTAIKKDAFKYNNNIKSVVITKEIVTIGEAAFMGCFSLESITVGKGVASIKSRAFYGCNSLKTIVIPDGVTSMGDEVLAECDSLESVTLSIGLTKISDMTFYGCSALKNIEIRGSVSSIGIRAFAKCKALTSIDIPDSVSIIGEYAFNGCSALTGIAIPKGVSEIGNWAFYECHALTSISVDKDNKNYTSMDGNLYTKDKKILLQYAIGKSETAFTIPDGVTTVNNGAFYYARLQRISFPSSLTTIGVSAFDNCSALTNIVVYKGLSTVDTWAFSGCSSIANVYYTGNEQDWKNIKFSSGNDYFKKASISYNYVP